VKNFDELEIRDGVFYSKTHEWSKASGDGKIRAGVSDYAQDALGDIVFVELPAAGTDASAGEPFGSLESTKAVSDLNAPVSGKIIAVNEKLSDSPELINSSPYDDGWIVEIETSAPFEPGSMMDGAGYREYLKTLAH
jgi:glycine cleavage system H protein